MSAVYWSSLISIISFMVTLFVAFFIMGTRWAKIGETVRAIDKRLERIEALFRLDLKDRHNGT